MSISLALLRTELRDHLGVDDIDLPNSDADLLLNRSWWEVMNKFDFREKEASRTFTTVAGTRSYANPVTQEAVQSVWVSDLYDGTRKQLDQLEIPTFEARYDSDTDARGKPEVYTRQNADMLLDPVPDDVYTITVYHLAILSDIPAGGPDVPQEWHEIILFGAIYRGFLRMGLHNRAKAIRKEQVDMISSTVPVRSKEQTDSRMAHVEVPNLRANY